MCLMILGNVITKVTFMNKVMAGSVKVEQTLKIFHLVEGLNELLLL